MDLIADGLLLAAALVAIFYCWAVNRRLGQLKQQSADLTGKLAHLDKTVTEVRTAIAEGRSLAEQERDRLGHLVKNADSLRRDLQRAAVTLEKTVGRRSPPTLRAEEEPPHKPAPRATKPAKHVERAERAERAERESSLSRVRRLNQAKNRRDVS